MPTGNRLARTPGPIRDFEGGGRISSGAAAPAAGGAEAYEALFSASAGFSDKLGKMADKAAAREGEAEGRAAGREAAGRVADDSFAVAPPKPLQLRRDGTIRGEAFDRAAQAAKGWRDTLALDTGIRQAYDENGDDPAALDASLGELRAEFSKGVGDPEQLEQFERVFDSKSLAYRLKAQTDAEQRAEAEMKAQGQGALDEQLAGFGKQMYLVGANPQGEAIMSDLLKQGTASIERAIVDGVISPQQGQRLVADYGNKAITARLAGVFDALPDGKARLGFAQGLMDAWKKDRGAFGKVDQGVVERISSKLQAKARHEISGVEAATRTEKQAMRQAIDDDVSSVMSTGEPLATGLSFDDVSATLGEADAVKWQARRGFAESYHSATGDMSKLTPGQISARVDALDPKPGSGGFEQAEKLQNSVLREAARVLTARLRDPAAAVDEFPEVIGARDGFDPEDAGSWNSLISARLNAQAGLDVPELNRKVLTEAETLEAAKGLPDSLTDQDAYRGMQVYAQHLKSRYGEFADEVMVQVMRQRGVDRDVAKTTNALLGRIMSGGKVRPADQAGLESVREMAAGDQAIAGQGAAATANAGDAVLPRPNARQLDLLIANPGLSQQFDEKFGAGQAEFYLSRAKQEPSRAQVNPDGSLSVPEDGGIMTLNPDGSESWEPADEK